MPSDTVWVALTGGAVTVSSLAVQGWLAYRAEKRRNEREDRLRAERELNELKEHYLNLLRANDQLCATAKDLAFFADDPRRVGPIAESLKSDLRHHHHVALRTRVSTSNERLLNLVSEIQSAAELISREAERFRSPSGPPNARVVREQCDIIVAKYDQLRVEITRQIGPAIEDQLKLSQAVIRDR